MLQLDDVKTCLSITTSGEDSALSGYINNGYLFFPVMYDTSTTKITDINSINSDKIITLKCKTSDISFTSGGVYVLDDYEWKALAASDYKVISPRQIYIKNYSNIKLKCIYTSSIFDRAFDEIVKDYVVYNYDKQLHKDGYSLRNSVVLGSEVNVVYKEFSSFKKEILERFHDLFAYIGI